MLGMLRRARKRRQERERNCPCKQTCLCHRPEPGIPAWIVPVFFMVLFGGIALVPPRGPPVKRTIHVGAQVCDVVFVVTDRKCDGHGGECRDVGYDQAVCPMTRCIER
jgi:hypothetical protein